MRQKQKKKHRASSGHEKNRPSDSVPSARIELVAPGRRGETKLQLPTGEPDLAALRSVTREWLVPLLVEKFLRERGIELRGQRPSAGPGKTPISDL